MTRGRGRKSAIGKRALDAHNGRAGKLGGQTHTSENLPDTVA